MRRVGLLGVLVLVLAVPAQAKKAAAVPDVFVGQGSWFKAANWSLGQRPSKVTPVSIPASHEATVPRVGAESGDLSVAGVLAGPQAVRASGSLYVAPGGALTAQEGLNLGGYGTITASTAEPEYLRLTGIHNLGGPLKVGEDLDVEAAADLGTRGYEVSVGRELYSFLLSALYASESTVRVGALYIYPPPWDEGQEGDFHGTNLTVNRPVQAPSLGMSTFACGCGWDYGPDGGMTLEGYEPQLYTANTAGSPEATTMGHLGVNRAVGGLTVQSGMTVAAEHVVSNGSSSSPAEVHSAIPGQPWVLRIPHSVTVEGCVEFKDTRVVGGTLTDPCEGDEGGNTGIVFG